MTDTLTIRVRSDQIAAECSLGGINEAVALAEQLAENWRGEDLKLASAETLTDLIELLRRASSANGPANQLDQAVGCRSVAYLGAHGSYEALT